MLENFKQVKRNNVIIAVNSTVMYIFTFLLVSFLYQLITATVASEYKVNTIFYLDKLKFLTPDNNFEIWNKDSALTVFGAAPLISLVLAFVCIMMYARFSEEASVMKLFFLWGALHLLNHVLGAFTIGTIFFMYGSNLLVDWMLLGMEMNIVLAAAAIILLIIVGNYSVMPILTSTNSNFLLQEENRRSFVFNQVYKPWLFGSIILFLFYLPETPKLENFLNVSMLIMLLPVYFRYRSPKFPTNELEEDSVYKLSWRFITILIFFIIILRIIFIDGIPFGGKDGSDMDYIWAFILIIAIISGLIYQFFKNINDKKREIRKIMHGDENY